MAKQTVNTLKNWFRTALKPTQAQFWDWMDSYFHKDDKIPLTSLDGLQEELDKKRSTDTPIEINEVSGLEEALENAGGASYTHPATHPTNILDGVDAVNGAEDYYLNQKGEFKRVEVGSSETGQTIRTKLEALTGDDKLQYSALRNITSSYTLDFRDDVAQIQDINIEGPIRIDNIQTINVATLQMGAITIALPLEAPIAVAQGAYNVWTITRNTATAASVGIKYTKL